MKISKEHLQRIVKAEMLREQVAGTRGKREKAARKRAAKPGELLRVAEKERLEAVKVLRAELKSGGLTREQFLAAKKEMRANMKVTLQKRRMSRKRSISQARYSDFLDKEVDALVAKNKVKMSPEASAAMAKYMASNEEKKELKDSDIDWDDKKGPGQAPPEEGKQAAKEKEVKNLEHDRKYEYKVVENRWHTRRRGKEKWIDLEPPGDEGRRKKFKKSVDRLDKAFPKERSAAPAAEEKKPEPKKVDEGRDITRLEDQMPEAWLQILGDCLEGKD